MLIRIIPKQARKEVSENIESANCLYRFLTKLILDVDVRYFNKKLVRANYYASSVLEVNTFSEENGNYFTKPHPNIFD